MSYEDVKKIVADLVPIELQKFVIGEVMLKLKEYADGMNKKLFDKYQENKNELLNAFSSPSFTYIHRESIKRLVLSDNPKDIEELILSILDHKIQHGNNPTSNLIIEKAMYATDKLSRTDLNRLAIGYCLMCLSVENKISKETIIKEYQSFFKDMTDNLDFSVGNVIDPYFLERMNTLDLILYDFNNRTERKFNDYVKHLIRQKYKNTLTNQQDLDYVINKIQTFSEYDQVRSWWDMNLTGVFYFTTLGRVISHLYIKDFIDVTNIKDISDIYKVE